ncbi:MAG TPA: dihydroorotase [Candidatus Fimadaptatus faecigallinarum]|uniref:Dihydroorotase n=1 Tax=Candidatus Fimadaptatus faecigallinarum TaxID=2840814 RepID=A0A9D1S5I3_9FIRM|nr:dihydroorotase [Candidatus Fimadaptatus faecigallinarum]
MLIRNGRIIDPANGMDAVGDLLIEDGKVVSIGEVPGADEYTGEVVDAQGCIVAPGFVDIHCHLRDPGLEYKEDMYTGTRAAAHGGFTSVCCMANTQPVNDNAAVTRAIIDKAQREGVVNVYPIGAITKGLKGQELAEMGQMQRAGAVAMSDDGHPVMNGRKMYLALQYAKAFNLTLISHSEDTDIVAEGLMNEGTVSTRLGLKGIPRAAEETMIARECILAEGLGARIHIAHVSTEGSVALIKHFKSRGVRVTAETAPHYVYGTDELVDELDYDSDTRVNPPLRTERDRQACIAGLKDGTLDCIATDHAPHHIDEKRVEYALAANGISGFETAFALCNTAMVLPGLMDINMLISKMTVEPARVLGLNKGTLTPGADADVVIIDPNAVWTIDPEKFLSKGKNTPFKDRVVTGAVRATYVAGKCVWQEA